MEESTPQKQAKDLDDFQLVARIRRIEASPTSHLSWKMVEARNSFLSTLRQEASERNLTV